MFYTVLQMVIPAYLLWYGYKLKFNTPEFGDQRHGVSSWRTRGDKAEWEAGNKFAGLLSMIYAVILAVIVTAKHLIYGTEIIKVFNYAFAVLTFVAIFSLVPVMHAYLKKHFGEREFVPETPPRRPRDPDAGGKKKKKKK